MRRAANGGRTPGDSEDPASMTRDIPPGTTTSPELRAAIHSRARCRCATVSKPLRTIAGFGRGLRGRGRHHPRRRFCWMPDTRRARPAGRAPADGDALHPRPARFPRLPALFAALDMLKAKPTSPSSTATASRIPRPARHRRAFRRGDRPAESIGEEDRVGEARTALHDIPQHVRPCATRANRSAGCCAASPVACL